MNKTIWIAIIILFSLLLAVSSLHARYRKDPWGSSTWEGPGRPPHWSPETTPKKTDPPKHTPHISSKHRGDSSRGKGAPGKLKSRGGYWKDKYNRWNYHKFRRPGFIYYREPKVETVIVEQQKRIIVYQPVFQQPSRPQCGGNTITRRDAETGTLIIEYVTGAQKCR